MKRANCQHVITEHMRFANTSSLISKPYLSANTFSSWILYSAQHLLWIWIISILNQKDFSALKFEWLMMISTSLNMVSDPVGHLHGDIQRLKRSMNWSIYALACLAVVVVGLLIALIAIGIPQHNSLHDLRQKVGIVKNPTVAFVTGFGHKNIEGLTYGGSLFRGSGFWATKAQLPGELTESIWCNSV